MVVATIKYAFPLLFTLAQWIPLGQQLFRGAGRCSVASAIGMLGPSRARCIASKSVEEKWGDTVQVVAYEHAIKVLFG